MNVTSNQTKVLHALLDKYENSKTYEGTNVVSQEFVVKPEKVWEAYSSDFANVEQVKDFETEMQVLEDQGLIYIRKEHGVITKLVACKEKLDVYYELLGRKQKKDIIQEQIAFYEGWMQKRFPDYVQSRDDIKQAEQTEIAEVADDAGRKKIAVIDAFCSDQIAKIRVGKKPDYELDVCDKLLRILVFILANNEEVLERELSMMILENSKMFEKQYRTRVCRVLSTYLDFSERLEGIDDTRERQKVILEEFQIFMNPSYIYLKGDMEIRLSDGQHIRMGDAPMALSSELAEELDTIQVNADTVVTVENLTTFHRMKEKDCAYLYLAGYHNSAKQAFLKRVYKENPKKQWYHFGDIDPDGFYILKHLRKGTGIDFVPLHMEVSKLETYREFCGKLSAQDRVKAENLLQQGFHAEVMQYMLEHDCKLEQEIISYEIMKKSL